MNTIILIEPELHFRGSYSQTLQQMGFDVRPMATYAAAIESYEVDPEGVVAFLGNLNGQTHDLNDTANTLTAYAHGLSVEIPPIVTYADGARNDDSIGKGLGFAALLSKNSLVDDLRDILPNLNILPKNNAIQ